MTDTCTDLPSREEIVGKIAHEITALCAATCCYVTGGWKPDPKCECRDTATTALERLTLLDLAAEMQRRGAYGLISHNGRIIKIPMPPAPQQEDTAE